MQRVRDWVVAIVRLTAVLSSLCGAGQAHEVVPAIADLAVEGGRLTLIVTAQAEAFVAGLDLTTVTDTNAAPQAADYDTLRALPPEEMEARFTAFWPAMAARLRLTADGAALVPELDAVEVAAEPDLALPRRTVLRLSAAVPPGTGAVTVGWDAAFGAMVLRQQGVEAPYTGFLEGGADSAPIVLEGGGAVGGWQTFFDYVPVGFDHIVPKGLDHILFVLGLFFLSTAISPLLWQVTAFTLAHTVTLALSSLGYVAIPASIVEPLIAASIVFVAVENVFAKGGLSPWRPAVVFGFGLLHGLGFASVLGDFGLPEGAFVPALIGFNIGVELGQLAVIAAAAALCWTWAARQDWYRALVAIPASLAVATVGGYWVVERTLL
jgi:hypothetical protein